MQKDFKAGMALGLFLTTVVIIWLSTRPSLGIKARALSHHSETHREINTEPWKNITIDKNPFSQVNSPIITNKPTTSNKPNVSESYTNEQSKRIKTERFHIVRSGETLYNISYKYYGSPNKWRKILGADHLPIENPSKLRPGTKLIIPE